MNSVYFTLPKLQRYCLYNFDLKDLERFIDKL